LPPLNARPQETHEPKDYLDQYDAFIQLMKDRRKANKKSMHISAEAVDATKGPRHR
jgi:hypothetical protein